MKEECSFGGQENGERSVLDEALDSLLGKYAVDVFLYDEFEDLGKSIQVLILFHCGWKG